MTILRATVDRYRAAYSGLPASVWMLAFVLFVNRSGAMVLPFLTLYLTSQLAMSDASAGLMISIYGLGSILGSYLGGRASQTFGAVRLQTVCMFLSVPGFLIIPIWSTFLPIALSLFALSVVSEAVRPASAAAVTKLTTAENRIRSFALHRLAANLGLSFGPAMGGILATIHFGLLFVVDALTTLIAACLLLSFFRLRRIEGGSNGPEVPHSEASPIRDRQFLIFLGLMLVNAIVFFQFNSTYPLYLRDHFSMSRVWIGSMFAVNTLVIVGFEMVLVDFVRRWPLVRTIGWGCLLSCVGFGILPFGSSGLFCIGAMLVLTLGEMLSFPLAAGFVSNRSRPGSEGVYMGWFTMTFSIASVLGPAIGSSIYQLNQDLVWVGCLLVGVMAWLGFQYLSLHLDAENSPQTSQPAIDSRPQQEHA